MYVLKSLNVSLSLALPCVFLLCVIHTQYSILARQETRSDGVTYLMPYNTGHGIVMVVRQGELNYKVSVVQHSVLSAGHCEVQL